MDLAPDGGPSSLTMAPENPPQLLLGPNLDVPAPCPMPGPPENPLKQLLVSGEGESQLWVGGVGGVRAGPQAP